jgi:hypothetical protein
VIVLKQELAPVLVVRVHHIDERVAEVGELVQRSFSFTDLNSRDSIS